MGEIDNLHVYHMFINSILSKVIFSEIENYIVGYIRECLCSLEMITHKYFSVLRNILSAMYSCEFSKTRHDVNVCQLLYIAKY